jgi:hypothetical protein
MDRARWTSRTGRNADDLIADLQRLAAAGVEHITLRFGAPDTSALERFARDVMPAFRANSR